MTRNEGGNQTPQRTPSQRIPLPYVRTVAASLLILTILGIIAALLLTGHWIATVAIAPLVGLAGIIAKKI